MASVLQQYRQLADHMATQITASFQSWTDFLTTAARLYKNPYHEQLMIYAQRPEATACADYELWNKRMGRYVRRGAKGIALIDNSGDNPKLKYVFDVADTRSTERSRSPYLWEYRPEHEQAVSAALGEQFAVPNDGSITEQLEQIWYMSHDMSEKAIEAGHMSIVRSLRGGFPEETEKLMVFLSEPESYQAIMRQVYAFRDACNADKGMMRFQMYHPSKLIRPLEEYTLPRREYVSEMAELPAGKGFITEDEINEHLTGGSNFSGSKGRIYAFYQTPHSAKEKLDFLKIEYGIGGGNNALSRNFMSHVWTDGKGIRYDKPNCTRIEVPWTRVVKYYDALMESGRFAPPEELEQRNDSNAVIDSEIAEEVPEIPTSESAPVSEEKEPAVWEYNEIKSAHPENIVLYQVGDFFEIYGEDAKNAAPVLDLNLGSRPIPTGGRVDMCGIPSHQLEQYTEKLRNQFSVTIAAVGEDGQRNSYSMGKLNPEPPRREITQSDIDAALQKWNGSLESKQAVVGYMEAHARERDTAAWLAKECGADLSQPLRITVTGVDAETVLPWAKVQRRIAQLIREDRFFTEQERIQLAAPAPDHSQENRPLERPYLVAAYHHIENGFDEKLDYQALEDAEKAAQGYVDGTMEDDGFQYDGAAVYDQQEHRYLRIYGDFPDEKAHAQINAPEKEPTIPDAQRISDEEFAREHLIPGESTFEIDGRTFLVDRVNLDFGSVNFQDITFANSTGFPIFRTGALRCPLLWRTSGKSMC